MKIGGAALWWPGQCLNIGQAHESGLYNVPHGSIIGTLGYNYRANFVAPLITRWRNCMPIDRIVFAVAGSMILLTLALGVEASPIFHHTNWHWFTAFVGANLLQSAFTGFCPLVIILKAVGMKPGQAFS